ncbi:MAG: restriction endonuclease [Litorimonas sp.]
MRPDRRGAVAEPIKRRLLATEPRLCARTQALLLVDPQTGDVERIEPDALSTAEWGAAYERHVGLHFEARGFDVDYRGLRLGLLDQGIDLIASRDGAALVYVQCKATSKRLGRQAIETILLKGGNFIAKRLESCDNPPKPDFCLALLDADRNLTATNRHRFLRHNALQNRTTLSILSLPWTIVEEG